MCDETYINPSLSSETRINLDLGQATEINPCLIEHSAASLPAGTVLAEKYQIIEPLHVSTGEANLYLCEQENKRYVAKVYRRQQAVKPEVIATLKAIDSPYVAALYDAGEYEGYPFEILPYYQNGSLQGKTLSLEEIKQMVVPCINEALHVLHQNAILHKDIKPSNMMLLEDGARVALIDFGISSVVEQGNTVLLTKTGMTPEYSAPETFKGLFWEGSDYYSFGIALFELYYGHTPYSNMSAEEIAMFTAVQRVPFPADMPEELRQLISAMTYYDITFRHDKQNPNRRWMYEEVKNWLEGKKQIIPGEGIGLAAQGEMPPYRFMEKEYKEIPSLVAALAQNWNEGKQQLYRGLLSAYFKSFAPQLAEECRNAEKEASRSAGQDDVIFWRLLYRLDPELEGFYWQGKAYGSLPALGRDMLERLWRQDDSCYAYWDGILAGRLLSGSLALMKADNQELAESCAALETVHQANGGNKRTAVMDYYAMAYLLSGQRIFCMDGQRFASVPELAAHMKALLDVSYVQFEDFCHRLIGYDDTLDAQLEAWLIALGKRNELAIWREQLAH